jgi:hypothetical protein
MVWGYLPMKYFLAGHSLLKKYGNDDLNFRGNCFSGVIDPAEIYQYFINSSHKETGHFASYFFVS